jgi:tetraacyldisaccharide 4'-kinase
VTLTEALLWPLTLPYGAITHLRTRAYRMGLLQQRRLPGVVISVGNLTAGGTAKTPMVLWIAERLAGEGKRAGILTRGYGGARTSAGHTSDEAQLLAARLGNRVELGVGADRWARGRELAQRGVEWFVLDDGFQHLQLARDVDIVLIDATNPFGGGRLIPAGRLREGRAALGRADIIVITRSGHAPAVEAAVRRHSAAPVFYARPQLDSVRVLRGEYPGVEDSGAGAHRYFAFCGIGNPAAFLADAREWNLQIAGHRFFPDHHRYTQRDMNALAEQARAAGAGSLLCTEKDVFNLAAVPSRPMEIRYGRISMRIDREEEFWQTVLARAESRKARPR